MGYMEREHGTVKGEDEERERDCYSRRVPFRNCENIFSLGKSMHMAGLVMYKFMKATQNIADS